MTSVTRRMARWCAQLGPFTTINIRPIAQQIYPILKRAKNLLSNTVKSHQNGEFRKIWSHWHPPSLSLSLFNMCSPRNESPINTHLSHESNEQTCSILDTVILSNLTLSPIYQHPQTHFKYRHSDIQLHISVARKKSPNVYNSCPKMISL